MRVVRRCLANGNVTDCADVRPLALQQFLWLLSETFEPEQTAEATFLTACGNEVLIEVSTSPRALQRWCAADQRLLCDPRHVQGRSPAELHYGVEHECCLHLPRLRAEEGSAN